MSTLRERIVEAASRRTVTDGWTGVTMGRLAADVGVSRQTVHTEVGTKGDLAQAVVLAELDRFLTRVKDAFAGEQDVADALQAAVVAVLRHAEESPLLRAVVTSSHGATTDLLPLLTTNAQTLLEIATTTVLDLVRPYDLPLPASRVDRSVEVVVRTVLSQVMYPTATPEESAEHLAWMVREILPDGTMTR